MAARGTKVLRRDEVSSEEDHESFSDGSGKSPWLPTIDFMCLTNRDGFRNRGVTGWSRFFSCVGLYLHAKTTETTPIRLVKRTSAVGVLSLEKSTFQCRGKQKAT